MVGSKENPRRNMTQVQFQGQGSGNFDKALQELGEVDQLAEIKANDHQWEGPEAVGQADPVGQRQPDVKVDIVLAVHHDDEKDEPVGCIGMVDKIEEEQIPDKGQNACAQVDKIPPGEKGHRNKQLGWQDSD